MRAQHGLLASFAFAWAGLAEGSVRDRNLRIHLALGVLVGAFAARAPLTPAERGLLLLCVALVVAAEATNSAIEAVVDLASPGWGERARIAKDAAAGAVLALVAGSVLVLLAVIGARADAIVASARALALPAATALTTAAATAFLPAPVERPRRTDLLVAGAGIAGLVHVSAGAESQAGAAVAALCLSIAVGGAAKRRARGGSRP